MRSCIRRLVVWGSLCAVLGSPAHGQPCAPDRDFDGHPLFGVFNRRLDTTQLGGLSNGGLPMSLDFGDVDGNGDIDVIAPLGDFAGFVSVSLNDGEGQFALPVLYAVGPDPSQAALADLDGDGDLDIAVTIDDDDTVETLINDGTGVFVPGAIYAVGRQPRSIVVGDLDGDGDDDLAALSPRSGSVSLLFNDGKGTFGNEVRVDLPRVSSRFAHFPGPFMALVDLEGDGDLDLGVPAVDRVVLVVNDGSGGFEVSDHQPRASAAQVHAIDAGDLDGDGDEDLAASITGAPEIMGVWLNNGDGTFPEATIYEAPIIGGGSLSVSLGDMDGDGDLDVALGGSVLGRHFIARNNGDGSFATPEDFLTKAQPLIVRWAEVNGDGWLDLGTIAWAPHPAAFLSRLNDGAGNLFKARNVEEDFPISGYSTADSTDVDGDGALDLSVATNENDPFDYRVLQADQAGTFVERHRGSFGLPASDQISVVRFSHMNGDEHVDLVFAVDDDKVNAFTPGSIWVAMGQGNFGFGDPVQFEIPDGEPWGMDIIDIDADGDMDVLAHVHRLPVKDDPTRALENWVVVLQNDGAGDLMISQRVLLFADRNASSNDVVACDIDGDGDPDVIATSGFTDQPSPLYVLQNDGGIYSVLDEVLVGAEAKSVGVGDWDGDGDLDAAAMHWRSEEDREYLTILDNDGSGRLTVTQTYTDTDIEMGNKMRVGDVNGDGWPDLVLAANRVGVVVHLNDRRGGFGDSAWYATNAPTGEPLIGDFDADGDADILSVSRSQGGLGPIVLLENVACCPADLDGDGTLSAEDFFRFLDHFMLGRADVDRDGDFDSEDFFAYLDLFAAGCP